jgi:hypothetical protein
MGKAIFMNLSVLRVWNWKSSWKDGIAGMGMGAKLGNGLIRIGMNIVRRPTGFRW